MLRERRIALDMEIEKNRAEKVEEPTEEKEEAPKKRGRKKKGDE